MKDRADLVLYKEGYVDSLKIANSYIMQGLVLIDNLPVEKAGDLIEYGSNIRIKGREHEYVSRGGLKLTRALDEFKIGLEGKISMDIGASTGGFTDCMLKRGASKVYSVDVGYGQLDWKLRNDSRVVVMERTNIRNVDANSLDDKLDFISIDVSFISLDLVLPVARELLNKNGEIVALIKPQFEAKKEDVEKGGIVRSERVHRYVIENSLILIEKLDMKPLGLTYSPITGARGNIEFLIHIGLEGQADFNIDRVIESSYDKFNLSGR